MKGFTLRGFITSLLLITVVFAYAYTVSKEDALTVAQRQFQGLDVDYFLVNDNSNTTWTVFVDAEPMKGWEHDCYTLKIPKSTSTPVASLTPSSKIKGKRPPSAAYEALYIKNRYGTRATLKPSVPKTVQTNSEAQNDAAVRTYALIINGGISTPSNHERYWNDCSFIYQTLVNKYGIPKKNIFPIMADGDDPFLDMTCETGGIMSQPLDLDKDGVPDIKLAATKANIQSTLTSILNKINQDDHLFIYVIDHGGDDTPGGSCFYLWGDESINGVEFADMLDPFVDKSVNVNVVLGQCFSGGMLQFLYKKGIVATAACAGDEFSFGCDDKPFDEFVYNWTCAINEADHQGNKIDSDENKDGFVSMKEAFKYARTHNRKGFFEHTQYLSTPETVGEYLAFNYVFPSIDLYIKDCDLDRGIEPNTVTKYFWTSPSICVRNQDDSIFVHENPEYNPNHQIAYVYVRIHNRGKEDYIFKGDKFIHVYWAQASPGFGAATFKGRELYENKYPTGGHLTASALDTIRAGEYKDFRVKWLLPQLLERYPDGNFHFCLLAKIMDISYDDGYVEGIKYFDVPGSNDQVQKNVTIINRNKLSKSHHVYMRNISSATEAYSLEIIPRETKEGISIFSLATVDLEMSPKIYSAWKLGGSKSENFNLKLASSPSSPLNERTVRFDSPECRLKSITLRGNEFDIVSLKVNFSVAASYSDYLYFDLIQKDSSGKIIGGETFAVESPTIGARPHIISETTGLGKLSLSVDEPEYSSFEWTDDSGTLLGTTRTIEVKPLRDGETYHVTVMTDDGQLSTAQICHPYKKEIVSIMASSEGLDVQLLTPAHEDSSITVTSLDGDTKYSQGVSNGSKNIHIDTPTITPGFYVVTYWSKGDKIDQKNVTIQ